MGEEPTPGTLPSVRPPSDLPQHLIMIGPVGCRLNTFLLATISTPLFLLPS